MYKDTALWERHSGDSSSDLHNLKLYADSRHETVVLLKQLRGTQSLVNFTSNGAVSEDLAIHSESFLSGMADTRFIMRYCLLSFRGNWGLGVNWSFI